jgi:hypothetical protein
VIEAKGGNMLWKIFLSIIGCLIIGHTVHADFPICTKDDEQKNPRVIWGKKKYLVVYSDKAGAGTWEDIYGKMVDTLADTSSQISICAESNPQKYPAAAFDGTNFLVVWEDNRTSNWDIYGRFVDALGNTVGETFKIVGYSPNRYGPVVGWNGTNYLVVWRQPTAKANYHLKAIRVNTSGGIVGSEITICTGSLRGQSWPNYAVTSDGDNYLVVWEDTATLGDVHGNIVNSSGTPQGEFTICAETGYQTNPSVDWTGAYYLVVWQGNPGDYRNEIYGIRLNSSGSTVGSYILIRAVDYVEVNATYRPKVVGSDSVWFVVWEEKPMDGVDVIYGATVDTFGTASSAFEISRPDSNERYPDVAFDGYGLSGNRWLVVWQDEREGIDNPDIYGSLTDIDGLPPTGIQLIASFTANPSLDGIVLSWRAESESSIIQYTLIRAQGKGEYKGLTGIPGSGSSPSPRSYSYEDRGVEPGILYYYKLGVLKTNGNTKWYGPVSAEITGIKPYLKIFPNPFYDKVNIEYCIGQRAEDIELEIFDATGRLVKNFILQAKLEWDGRDNNGKVLPSGIYYCKLNKGTFTETKKIMLVR